MMLDDCPCLLCSSQDEKGANDRMADGHENDSDNSDDLFVDPTGELPPDLGNGLERLLRPADGDDDLHDAGDDDPPQPPGGPAGRI